MALRRKQLSPRLKTILSFVEGDCLADIGTDHGYLPIEACLDNIVKKALACDYYPGPLSKAVINIERFGLADKIETRLGFGLQPVEVGEADSAVISGMGGMKIIEILSASKEVAKNLKMLIVQPQHDIPAVRQYLSDEGFEIFDEVLIVEKHRKYTVIAAKPI